MAVFDVDRAQRETAAELDRIVRIAIGLPVSTPERETRVRRAAVHLAPAALFEALDHRKRRRLMGTTRAILTELDGLSLAERERVIRALVALLSPV